MRKKAKTLVELLALVGAMVISGHQYNIATDSNELPMTGARPPAELQRIDRGMKSLLKRWNLPGASVAICKDGRIIFARGYGFADLDEESPVVPEKSLFRIASVSKPITACAILKLVEEDKINLDEKALQALDIPTPGGRHADWRLPNIRVRDLLQMSAGWDKDRSGDPILQPYIFRAARRFHQPAPANFDTTMQYVFSRRLDYTPGTKFCYSNFEYGLLGKLVEKRTGLNYEDYVRTTFFEPAGVQLFKAHTREEDRLPNEVVYYAPLEPSDQALLPEQSGRKVKAPYCRAYMESDLPILGWVATAPELAILIDKLTSDEGLLKRETRQIMTERPKVPCWRNKRSYFALGWEVTQDARGRLSMYKDGTLPGTRAFVEHTADGLTWVALFNGRPPQKLPDKFAHQVRETMTRGLDYVQLSKPAPPSIPDLPEDAILQTLSPQALDKISSR